MTQDQSRKVRTVRLVAAVLSAAAFTYSAFSLADYIPAARKRAYLSQYTLVQGAVVNKGQSLRTEANMQFPNYLIRYSFHSNGRRIEGRGTVSREWYNWLKRGENVEIYFDPSHPERHFLKLEYDYKVGRFYKAAVAAAVTGLILALLSALRKPAQMLVRLSA